MKSSGSKSRLINNTLVHIIINQINQFSGLGRVLSKREIERRLGNQHFSVANCVPGNLSLFDDISSIIKRRTVIMIWKSLIVS